MPPVFRAEWEAEAAKKKVIHCARLVHLAAYLLQDTPRRSKKSLHVRIRKTARVEMGVVGLGREREVREDAHGLGRGRRGRVGVGEEAYVASCVFEQSLPSRGTIFDTASRESRE